MENKELFGYLAALAFFAILFTEQGAKTWMLFGFLGIIFWVIWM